MKNHLSLDRATTIQPPPDVTTRPRPVDLCPKGPTGDSIERQASEDSNDLTPVPPPQKSIRVGGQRCCLDPCPLCCALTCWEAVCSLLTSPALGQHCAGLGLLIRAPGFGLQQPGLGTRLPGLL